jgi:hypothetical protein
VLNLDDLHISTGLLKILRTLFENHKEVLTHSRPASTPQPPLEEFMMCGGGG